MLLLTGAGHLWGIRVGTVVTITTSADGGSFCCGATVGWTVHADPRTLARLEHSCWACWNFRRKKERKGQRAAFHKGTGIVGEDNKSCLVVYEYIQFKTILK